MKSSMLSLSHQELLSRLGSDRVERCVRDHAKALGSAGPTLGFLCDVGVPSMPKAETGAPGADAHHRAFDAVQGGQRRACEEAKDGITWATCLPGI
ncbi:hypothetical protein [Streptomyces sp. TE5632]